MTEAGPAGGYRRATTCRCGRGHEHGRMEDSVLPLIRDRLRGGRHRDIHLEGPDMSNAVPEAVAPTETDWVHACNAIVGTKEYYKHIQSSKGALESLDLIERC